MLKKIFIPKYLLIALIALIFLISGSDNNNNITHAQSGSLLSLFGFAWSENFGWISFNNSDCNNEEYELCQNISSPYDNLPYSCYPELNYFMDCGRVTPTNIPPCTRTSQVNPTTKYCVLCPPGYTKTAAWQVGGGTFWEEPNACCSNSRTGGIANCAITCATSECTANGGKCIDWCYKCNHDAVNYICDNTSGMPDCPINNPNGYDCTSATWRVQIDETTGDMSGYAWSPYLDYISFERSTAGDPPQAPYNTGSGPIAKYGLAGNPYGIPEKYLDGWARALLLNDASGNQNGWIRLSGTAQDSSNYGAYVADDGQFEGYAWNGNDTASTGIGWIKFNSRTPEASSPQFNVWAPIPTKPIILSVVPVVPDNCNTLDVNWGDAENERGYWLFASTTAAFTPGTDNRYAVPINQDITHAVVNTVPPANESLQPGSTYYFIVGAYNLFGTAYSNPFPGTTYPICRALFNVDLKSECPNIVHLAWTEPAHAASCVIDDYEIRRCHCSSGCANCNDGANYTVNHLLGGALTNYDDTNFHDDDADPDNDTYDKYRYQIKAYCASGEESEWSDPSDIVIPCPSIPIWRETKPN